MSSEEMSSQAEIQAEIYAVVHGHEVPVDPGHLSPADVRAALDSTYFRDWAETLDPSIAVRKIHLQGLDWFGKRVGFLKIRVEANDRHGNDLPGIIFMRGGGVVILPILDSPEGQFVVCVRQARVPTGAAAALELPAGMLDGNGDFSGIAAKELKEETGMEIRAEELIDLTELAFGASAEVACGNPNYRFRGIWVTPGGSEEHVRMLHFRKSVTADEISALQGRLCGCTEEGEVIRVEVVKYENLWQSCPDALILSCLFIYERLLASGRLPPS